MCASNSWMSKCICRMSQWMCHFNQTVWVINHNGNGGTRIQQCNIVLSSTSHRAHINVISIPYWNKYIWLYFALDFLTAISILHLTQLMYWWGILRNSGKMKHKADIYSYPPTYGSILASEMQDRVPDKTRPHLQFQFSICWAGHRSLNWSWPSSWPQLHNRGSGEQQVHRCWL